MSLTETHQERLDAIQASKAAGKPRLDGEKNGVHAAPKKKPGRPPRDRKAERARSLARAGEDLPARGRLPQPPPLDRIGQLQAVATVRDQVGGVARLKQLLEVLALLDEEDAPPEPSLMREG